MQPKETAYLPYKCGFHSNPPTQRLETTARNHNIFLLKLNSVALVREQTIPTEQPPLVGEVSANFFG
jgi:hypothetical protein